MLSEILSFVQLVTWFINFQMLIYLTLRDAFAGDSDEEYDPAWKFYISKSPHFNMDT